MGKLYDDRIASETLPPIVINPVTVNSHDDPTVLPPDQLSVGKNIILDNGIIEKPKTTYVLNDDASPVNPAQEYGVRGLHRAYANDGTKQLIRVHNGTVSETDGTGYQTPTEILWGLDKEDRLPFINVQGKAYGINPTNGLIRYNPLLNDSETMKCVKANIVCPFLRKKIAFFEWDETWAGDPDTSVTMETTTYRAEEFSGKAVTSRRIKAGTEADHYASASSSIALDLTRFNNGKFSDENDYIVFWVYVTKRPLIEKISIEFSVANSTFTGNYFVGYIERDSLEEGDHKWSELKIRKSEFEWWNYNGGTPVIQTAVARDWSDVHAVWIGVEGTADTTATNYVEVIFDYCYMKAETVQAHDIRVQIASCDHRDGDWAANDSAHFKVYSGKAYEGGACLRFGGADVASVNAHVTRKAGSLDLTHWPDGTDSSDSDQIVFHVMSSDYDQIGQTPFYLDLALSTNTADYLRATVDPENLGLIADDTWFEVRVKKSDFTAAGGATTALWATIDYVRITTPELKANDYLYVDDIKMEQYQGIRVLADFEGPETENWQASDENVCTYPASDNLGFGEGSIKLYRSTKSVASKGSATEFDDVFATYVLADALDLTTWEDGSTSGTYDFISWYLAWQDPKRIKYVEIWFSCTDENFTNAYRYQYNASNFADKKNSAKWISIKKSDFAAIGTAPTWASIKAIRVVNNSNGGPSHGAVWLDYITMKRRKGNSGRYYYKYTFRMGDIESAPSEISEKIDVKGSYVSLKNIATSADGRVTSRWIYRMGGDYPSNWMLVKILGDNTTTEVVDDVADEDLDTAMTDNVPQGVTDGVFGSNLIYDPQADRILVWGNTDYKNRIFFSHKAYYHAFDELGYREFPDEVMAAVPWYGQVVIFFRNGAKKIVGDVASGDMADLPIPVGCCSYYSFCKVGNGLIAHIGADNVYLFDGYRSVSIGDQVRNYLTDTAYPYLDYTEAIYFKDAIYISLKIHTDFEGYDTRTVLRYYIPRKSWTMYPDWNASCFAVMDQCGDYNILVYGDAYSCNAFQSDYASYQQYEVGTSNAAAIDSDFSTGWINVPDTEIAVTRIELKALEEDASGPATINFYGYTNMSSTEVVTASIEPTENWETYTLQGPTLHTYLRGDFIKLRFRHNVINKNFKMKDIVVYLEKLPKRAHFNEVTVTPG